MPGIKNLGGMLVVMLLACATTFGQSGGLLQLHLDLMRFQSGPESYVELQLYFDGARLTSMPTPDGQWRSAVDLLLYFEQDGQIVQYDRLLLNSPVSSSPGADFIDIRRYGLPPGSYELVLEALDAHRTADTLRLRRDFVLPAVEAVWSQSDLMLLMAARPSTDLHALVRNGYYMEPLPHRFYPRTAGLLFFYQEVYCRDTLLQGQPYLFAYHIEERTPQGNRKVQQAITRKRKARTMDPVLIQMDIRHLASGNYQLVTEVRDTSLQLLSTSTAAFQRSNPDQDTDTAAPEAVVTAQADTFLIQLTEAQLNYALRATAPRVWDREVDLLNATIRNASLEAKRNFLLHFHGRENAQDPTGAYEAYMAIARAIDKQFFSGFGFGFESDRGFAYMKYGKPNDIIDVEDEPHAPPYQIWVYDEFPYTGQRNVKFLFYNPSLAPGNYLLLHSTARNERQNPRWEIDLYSKLGGNEIMGINQQDAMGVRDQYFRMARKYFEDN